jgi:hypothetical protein
MTNEIAVVLVFAMLVVSTVWDFRAWRRRAKLVRMLPVLRRCGDCRWCEPTSGGWSCDHERSVAEVQRSQPRCPQGWHVDPEAPPPAGCPMRGAK